jgi:hypothetical protein
MMNYELAASTRKNEEFVGKSEDKYRMAKEESGQ